MDALPLDPSGYDGTYKLVGGQSSLDLINTLAWPGTAREHDWFEPPTNVTLWAVEVGLIDEHTRRRLHATVSRAANGWKPQVAAVRRIRDILRQVIAPVARGQAPSRRSIDELNRLLGSACSRRHLDRDTLDWSWSEPGTLEALMAPVVWNGGHVLSSIDPERLGHCPSCGWLFHDTTRNRSRRWCDMGDCGSRDKALRYYHRHKPTPTGERSPERRTG